MRHRIFILPLLAALISSCVSTGGGDGLPTSVKMPPLATMASGQIEIGNKLVPLPEGQFQLAGTGIQANQKSGHNLTAMLLQTRDGRVVKAVEIFSNRPANTKQGPPTPGWVTHRSCNRDDIHFVELIQNERLGDQDCWWVNHWRMVRTGSRATEHWKETRKYLSDNKITAPIEMIGVSYRVANKSDFLTVNYFFNPEDDGFPVATDDNWAVTTWSTSKWHPDQMDGETKKQYIEGLISWGRSMHERVLNTVR
ncbi:MAG: hypothetical protein ISR44_09740 [Rhodospirillales bacterium]|nr:hypothetical protein [Rhodospirillales bacterium]